MGEETDVEALKIAVRHLGHERDRLTRERRNATDRLQDSVIKLIHAGVSELEASKLAGVSRQTVRKWAGKQGWNPPGGTHAARD